MNQTAIHHSINLRPHNSNKKSSWNAQQQNDLQSKQLLRYLNSQQSQIMDTPKLSKNTINNPHSISQKYYLLCPELYQSYQLKGTNFILKRYNKGRNELHFQSLTQIQIPNIVKLTVWQNGDYKLIYNQQVYFWHEQEVTLDKYCVTI